MKYFNTFSVNFRSCTLLLKTKMIITFAGKKIQKDQSNAYKNRGKKSRLDDAKLNTVTGKFIFTYMK